MMAYYSNHRQYEIGTQVIRVSKQEAKASNGATKRRVIDIATARTTAFESPLTESIDDVSGRTDILESIADSDGCARNPTSSSMSSKMRTYSEERICISESSNVQVLAIDIELINLGPKIFKCLAYGEWLSWLS